MTARRSTLAMPSSTVTGSRSQSQSAEADAAASTASVNSTNGAWAPRRANADPSRATSAPPNRISTGRIAHSSTRGRVGHGTSSPVGSPAMVVMVDGSYVPMRSDTCSEVGRSRSSTGAGMQADPEHRDDDRGHDRSLAPAQVGQRRPSVLQGALERALVGPEHVDGAEDHADDRDRGQHPVDREGAEQHEELADEVVEPGQADRRQHRDHVGAREPRRDLHDAAEVGDLARVRALVEHAEHEEQHARAEARGSPSGARRRPSTRPRTRRCRAR